MFKIHILTYILLLVSLFSGTFKNLIIIYLIVLFHELGHILICLKYGFRIKEILILPFGGITKIDKCVNTNTSKEFFIASAGVINQLILFILITILFNINILSFKTYSLIKYYNFIIMGFNLIPIIPLDGYIILKSLLEKIMPFKLSFYISIVITILGTSIFIYLNYLYKLNNYLIISFIIYKIIIEIKDFKYIYHKFLLERYFNDLIFKKVKIFKQIKLQKMYKDKYHFFISDGNVYSENKILNKLFDKKPNY